MAFCFLHDCPSITRRIYRATPSKYASPHQDQFLKVKPRKGDAIVFYSMAPNLEVDEAAWHAGCPPVVGTKVGCSANKNMQKHAETCRNMQKHAKTCRTYMQNAKHTCKNIPIPTAKSRAPMHALPLYYPIYRFAEYISHTAISYFVSTLALLNIRISNSLSLRSG
jgi:hypothetical protein